VKTAIDIWEESDGTWWVKVYDVIYRFPTREEAEDCLAAYA
jgi:hypothetical protein